MMIEFNSEFDRNGLVGNSLYLNQWPETSTDISANHRRIWKSVL